MTETVVIEAIVFTITAQILLNVLPRRHPIRPATRLRKGLVLVGVAAVEYGVRLRAHLVFRRLCGGDIVVMLGTAVYSNVSKGSGEGLFFFMHLRCPEGLLTKQIDHRQV